MLPQPPTLATEQIYDALFDDDAFARLPDLLARTVNARSATLAWRYRAGGTEVLRHNGYFTDAHFEDYVANYAEADPWIAVAYRHERMNRAIRMDEEIDAASVRRTAFYSDWLRGMGDDTLHCLGAATTMRDGDGIIGLHRGAAANAAFSEAEAGRLAELLPHLTRLLVLRGRLADADRRMRTVEEALDATGMAMVIVDAVGRVRMSNAAGDAALAAGGWLAYDVSGILSGRPLLASSVGAATRRNAPMATAIVLTRRDGAQLTANVTPFATRPGSRDAMILFRPPADWARRDALLRQLFGLTCAEAEVAALVTDGATLTNIAGQRGTTLETVRAQLRIIRQKTGCSRQTELAVLLNRLPL